MVKCYFVGKYSYFIRINNYSMYFFLLYYKSILLIALQNRLLY